MSSAYLFSRCACDEDINTLWTAENILQCQKISDFLISIAYFSIPLELLYFVSCSSIFPFRWVLIQFSAFIVLCGSTHFVNVWTYASHSFHVMLVLTILKFLTALVSCATSVTLITLIPQMLRVMVREGLLRKKTRELGLEVGIMKQQEQASWHVRMLTQEIRKSLDRHTILYTTLVELSKVLFLENCAVWMPDRSKMVMNLTHVLKSRQDSVSISISDADVVDIMSTKGVRVLGANSKLRGPGETGAAAAIRMPLLRVSNFKGGTPELVEECYAILVLILPPERIGEWSPHNLEIIEVVADQVAVALSHAAVLEESLAMREKLLEQKMILIKSGKQAILAREARNRFRKVISHEMTIPARSISAILSILQLEKLSSDQKLMVDSSLRDSLLLTSLIEDATRISNSEDDTLEFKPQPFNFRSMLRQTVGISKLLCSHRNLNFDLDVSSDLPSTVIGDEKRILQIILYMIGHLSNSNDPRGIVLHVSTENQGTMEPKVSPWGRKSHAEYVRVKFEARRERDENCDGNLLVENNERACAESLGDQGLSSTICRKLALLMCGNVSISMNEGNKNTIFIINLQLQKLDKASPLQPLSRDHEITRRLLKGMNILLADKDDFSRSTTRKLFEKLDCNHRAVCSWHQCLETLRMTSRCFHLLLIDLDILQDENREVSGRVRKLQLTNWIRIIVLISKLDKETRAWCIQHGMHGALCKPVILPEMAYELQRIIPQAA